MRRRLRIIEAAVVMGVACSCGVRDDAVEIGIPVRVAVAGEDVKSAAPDAGIICNLNLFVIGEGGMAEEHRYWDFERYGDDGMELKLLEGRRFEVFAFANAGYDLGVLGKEELEELRWNMRYPDSFDHGIPMSCRIDGFEVRAGTALNLELVRMVSRISVSLDRSGLDKDVDFFIREARIGNCAKSAGVFFESGAVDENDLFASGYHAYCSDEFELFTLENCQGGKSEKLSSYVEMEIDYNSQTYFSDGEKGLVYRFYLRENDDYGVRRNCHYRIVVRPHADGLLSDDSWRVDKSALSLHENSPYLRFTPSGTTVEGVFYANYYRLGPGDSLHLRLSRSPASMGVYLDPEMVEMERDEGRALYSMDMNGRGIGIRSLGRYCRSTMNICVEEPYSYLDDMIVIEVVDRGSGQ